MIRIFTTIALCHTTSLALLLATSSLCCSPYRDYRFHVKQYHGMRETSYNRGPFIDSANRKYGYIGAPYCATAASVILDRAQAVYPSIRSARSRAFITDKSINARRIWEGKDTIPTHSLVVFIRKGGGHIEFHIENKGGVMRCFGFNTTPDGKSGSQWNGVWSGYKNRNIKKSLSPYSVFRVTHFTPVYYAKPPKSSAVDRSVAASHSRLDRNTVRYSVKSTNVFK